MVSQKISKTHKSYDRYGKHQVWYYFEENQDYDAKYNSLHAFSHRPSIMIK